MSNALDVIKPMAAGAAVGAGCNAVMRTADSMAPGLIQDNLVWLANCVTLWLVVPVLYARLCARTQTMALLGAHGATACALATFYAGRVENIPLILTWWVMTLLPVTVAAIIAYRGQRGFRLADMLLPVVMMVEPIAPRLMPAMLDPASAPLVLQRAFTSTPPALHLLLMSVGLVLFVMVMVRIKRSPATLEDGRTSARAAEELEPCRTIYSTRKTTNLE